MQSMKNVQWVLYFLMIGAVVVGGGAGLMWLADSDAPIVPSLAKAMAFGFCICAVLWLCVQAAIWNSGWKVGKVSGKLENPWEVAYQEQLANSLTRERRIG